MTDAKRDQNYVTTLLGVSSADGITPVTIYVDPITHRLLTSASISAVGADTQVIFNDGGLLAGNANLTFNKTTGILTATGFVGALTGNVTGNASTAGSANILTTARAINGVNFNGSAPITVPLNNANDATNADYFVIFTSLQGGNYAALTSTGLKYHPSTGILTASGFVGPLTGAASSNELLSNKATTFGTINDTLYPTVKAVNDAITSAVVGLLDYRGSYNASTNLFPATGGSGIAGAILKGDFWIVSVSGTLGTIAVTPGDLVIALVDTPAQTAANWDLIQHNLNDAYLSKAGGTMTGDILGAVSLGATGTRLTKVWTAALECTALPTINGGTLATALNLSGKADVGQTMYIGTTAVAINRASAALVLTGITSIDGNAATATKLATARAIYGNNFDGSAALTQVIAATYGGTGIAYFTVAGPTQARTYTFPDADSTVATIAATQTLTNKRITKRVLSATSYTTDTGSSLNSDTTDVFIVTAQAGALKFNNPSGTPTDGQTLWIAVTGTAARALTWDTSFEASAGAALPTTTVTTARLDIGFIWRADTSKWHCVAVA